jgi:hypothetical protein
VKPAHGLAQRALFAAWFGWCAIVGILLFQSKWQRPFHLRPVALQLRVVCRSTKRCRQRPPSTLSVICVYNAAGNVIETHEHKGDFKEW